MNRSGSVLMEYIVLVCGVGIVVILLTSVLFYNPITGFVGPTTKGVFLPIEGIEGFGEKLVDFYRNLQDLIALPVP